MSHACNVFNFQFFSLNARARFTGVKTLVEELKSESGAVGASPIQVS